MIRSTSYTHPAHVPPLARCSAAQSRVSSGSASCGASAGCGALARAPPRIPPSVRASPVDLDDVDRTGERRAIDHDLDDVAVAHAADRTAVQRLRTDVADARAGRDAGEAAVRDQRDVLAPRQISERRRDLRRLLHAGARRTVADQHDDVALANRGDALVAALHRANRVALVDEHARRSAMPIHLIVADDRRIDRRRFDHRSLGARLPTGNTTVLVRPARRAASGLMITSSGDTLAPAASRARARLRRSLASHQSSVVSSVSPVAVITSSCSSPIDAKMQHHLGHAARHEHLHGRMTLRPVRQRVDEPRRRAIDANPVVDRRRAQTSRVRDRRNVQQQIRRPAERRVHEHRVLDRVLREDAIERNARARAVASARVADRAPSSNHAGSPDGASALCGSASPNASATTCDVAAVPRN